MRRICLILPLFAFVSCAFESTMVITGYEGQSLFAGSTVQLTSNLPDAQWYSSNPDIATVDETGLVSISDTADDDIFAMSVVHISAISKGQGYELAITVPPPLMFMKTFKFYYNPVSSINKVGYFTFNSNGTGSASFNDAYPYDTPGSFSFKYWFDGSDMFTDQGLKKIGIDTLPDGGQLEARESSINLH